MRTPVSCTALYTPLFTLYSKKMMLLIGSKKPLPDEEQRPEFTFTEKLFYLRPVWANQREARRRRAAKPARASAEKDNTAGSGTALTETVNTPFSVVFCSNQ